MGERLGRISFEVVKNSDSDFDVTHSTDVNTRLALMHSSATPAELAEIERHRAEAARHVGLFFSLLDNPRNKGVVRAAHIAKPGGLIKA